MAIQIVRILPKALLQNVGVNERIHVVCSDDCGEPLGLVFTNGDEIEAHTKKQTDDTL